MTKRRRRSLKRRSAAGDIFHFILAIALIAAAVVIVAFVVGKIRGITGEMIQKPEQTEAENQSAETDISISNEAEQGAGFRTDSSGATKWQKADGSFAKNEWIAEDGGLYYFNENELMQTGTLGIEGMLYTFGADGAVERIRYNPDYQPDQNTVIGDYPSLVKSKRFWAFLQEDEALGEFSALMYKRTTEAMAYQLGGEDNPQYTGPYSMQIDGDYIYFLPLSEETELSDEEAVINGRLYRMKPGDTVRQIVAENVDGYKVFDGTVYYESGGKLYQTQTAENDETKNPKKRPAGDEVFHVEISDGAAYLTDAYGEMVRSETGDIRGRGFTYYLNMDGTIKGVQEKTTVNTGGYTYYAESDTAFGEAVSRMMRKNEAGKTQVISTEFAGTVGNLHYDYDTGNMIAEYTDEKGRGRIIRISKSGDVDLIADDTASAGKLELLAVQDGAAVAMKQSGGKNVFVTLTIANVDPLAVGVDPVDTGDSAPEEDGDTVISDAPEAQPEEAANKEKQTEPAEVKKQEETHARETEASPRKTTEAEKETEAAPQKTTAAPAQPSEPKTEPVQQGPAAELVGPESGAVIGGAPPA